MSAYLVHLPVALTPTSMFLLLPVLFATLLIATTYVYTNLRYRYQLRRWTASSPAGLQAAAPADGPQSPPSIPYAVPILGSALSFLSNYPGSFWQYIFTFHPRAAAPCFTVLLGGQHANIVYSPTAVQALFKRRELNRDNFNLDIMIRGLGCEPAQARRYHGEGLDQVPHPLALTPQERLHHWNQHFLVKTERVNELTASFTSFLAARLAAVPDAVLGAELDLYDFMRHHIFTASTTAFMGSTVFRQVPDLAAQFFAYDQVMLTLFFGMPRLLAPGAHACRKTILDAMARNHALLHEKYRGMPTDPDGDVAWEEDYGGKANRAKQVYYEQRGLTMRARAALDLGFLFALNSNAIPAIGWMLMHLLDPAADPAVLAGIMEEIRSAERTPAATTDSRDGHAPLREFDVSTLCAAPRLQSAFHETLRLYVDLFVARELHEDLVLPLEGGREAFFKAPSLLIAPSYLGHRDETVWTDPPVDVWHAERFLRWEAAENVDDSKTSTDSKAVNGSKTAKDAKSSPSSSPLRPVFTTSSKENGKIFPFGGGRTICPGRVFAKQEVLAAVAIILSEFEVEWRGWRGEDGAPRAKFPGLRKSYGGAGTMQLGGDLRCVLKRRSRREVGGGGGGS